MVYSRQSRDVLFFDIHVERRAKHANFPPMAKIAELLEAAALDDDFPVKEFDNGDITYIIKDAVIDKSNATVSILLECSDKNAPDARYVNHNTKTKRDFNKVKDEGGGHSAHVVISLTPEATGGNVYIALIEKVPNFAVHRIQSLLNTAIRLLCQEKNYFFYQPAGGSKKQIPFVPHLEFFGHISKKFQNDLENGKINSITLIEPDAIQPLGQGKYFSGVEKYMKVKMLRKPNSGSVLSEIRAAARSQSKDYSRIRVSFKPEAGGQSTHVDLDSGTGMLIGDGYVKTKTYGGISPPILTSAVDNLVPHLISRMKDDLLKERS